MNADTVYEQKYHISSRERRYSNNHLTWHTVSVPKVNKSQKAITENIFFKLKRLQIWKWHNAIIF